LTYNGRHHKHRLKLCPACGMDSGERMCAEHEPIESYYIICTVCGFKTKEYASCGAAARAWNAYRRNGNNGNT
jgi:hypothetical protein